MGRGNGLEGTEALNARRQRSVTGREQRSDHQRSDHEAEASSWSERMPKWFRVQVVVLPQGRGFECKGVGCGPLICGRNRNLELRRISFL